MRNLQHLLNAVAYANEICLISSRYCNMECKIETRIIAESHGNGLKTTKTQQRKSLDSRGNPKPSHGRIAIKHEQTVVKTVVNPTKQR